MVPPENGRNCADKVQTLLTKNTILQVEFHPPCGHSRLTLKDDSICIYPKKIEEPHIECAQQLPTPNMSAPPKFSDKNYASFPEARPTRV